MNPKNNVSSMKYNSLKILQLAKFLGVSLSEVKYFVVDKNNETKEFRYDYRGQSFSQA